MNPDTHKNVADTGFPASGSPREKLGYAVKCAIVAAPSDGQHPPLIRITDTHVALAVPRQHLLADDTNERNSIVHCGAMLFRLRLAMKCLGCLGRVELFPDLDRAGLMANLHLGLCSPAGPQESPLFAAMSSPGLIDPMSEPPMSVGMLDVFENAVAGEKAWMEFSRSEASRNHLAALASGARAPAVPLQSLTFYVRPGDMSVSKVRSNASPSNSMAEMAVIKTKTDDKRGWLATGQALARVTLLAKTSNISCRVFGQAFRHRYARESLRTAIGHKGFAQAIVGLGHPQAQPTTAPVMEMFGQHGFEPEIISPETIPAAWRPPSPPP